jgi:glycerate kinase
VRAISAPARLGGVELLIACDVTTTFVDAARVFGPQKGATVAQVELLTRRLQRTAQMYLDTHGVDVTALPGSGAAGGLAGGLAALGGRLVGGFDLVAEEVDLERRLADADVVITGEGYLDAQSFEGKVVGGVTAMAAPTPVHALVGDADPELLEMLASDRSALSTGPLPETVTTLVGVCGREAAWNETLRCIERCTAEIVTLARQRG